MDAAWHCRTCGTDWPRQYEFRKCPRLACEAADCIPDPKGEPIPLDLARALMAEIQEERAVEAKRRAVYEDFERRYAEREALRIDRECVAFAAELEAFGSSAPWWRRLR